MNNSIFDLLENKGFDELTKNERLYVLKEMSESEYSEQRQAVLMAKEIFTEDEKTMNPNPEIMHTALNVLHNKKKKRSGIFILFAHKTPTWVAVAAGAVLVLILSNLFKPNNTVIVQNESRKPDTVIVEKTITELKEVEVPGDTVIKIVYRTLPAENIITQATNSNPEPAPKSTVKYPDEILNLENQNLTSFVSSYKQPKGLSLSKDTLAQLVNDSYF